VRVPEVASAWADRLVPIVEMAWSPDPNRRGFYLEALRGFDDSLIVIARVWLSCAAVSGEVTAGANAPYVPARPEQARLSFPQGHRADHGATG
jgi:hypothetical protein